MKPWSTYSFRVIAYNEMGTSIPEEIGETCTSPPDVPYTNPDGLQLTGVTPTSLLISWYPMPPSEHNGPGFYYRVHWKRQASNGDWNIQNIANWTQDHLLVENQVTYVEYRIKIDAANEIGVSNHTASELFGYSGEGVPTEAPTNFALIETGNTSVILHWTPVPLSSLNGNIKGYIIHVWNDIDGDENKQTIEINDLNALQASVELCPDATNFMQIFACNGQYEGPKSDVIEFKMLRRVSCPIQSFIAFPLGSSAILLRWNTPAENITGYKISFEDVGEGVLSYKGLPMIENPDVKQWKLTGLKAKTKYRIHIAAITETGEGER